MIARIAPRWLSGGVAGPVRVSVAVVMGVAMGLLRWWMPPVNGGSSGGRSDGRSGYCQCLLRGLPATYRGRMDRNTEKVDLRARVREFLSSRRARITPQEAGL